MGMLDMKITQDMLNHWKKVIPDYQFMRYTLDNSLEGTLYHPVATNVGQNAFQSCNNLININFPLVTGIGQHAFFECTNLTSVNLPEATNIGDYVFGSCRKLTSVNMPNITTIGQYAFSYCTNLININLPLVTIIRFSAFNSCINLTNINFPLVTSIGQYAFYGCSRLTTVTLGSNLYFIATTAFQNCTSLATINVIGDENCVTAQTLATLTPAQYNNATIVYNYTPPSENEGE